MNKLSILVLSCLISMSAMFASADILRGKIVDKQTKLPVEGASVEVTSREGNRIQMSTCTTDSSGIFTNRSDLINTTIVVQAIGYYERTLRHPCFEGSDTIELNDIEIRPSEIFLNNLEVTAKAKRFTLRGDTIVFNPNAFSLEAGERLEALIQKLPGVKIESDGTLSWNGRPVRLMMNGQKALDSSLIGQLPVEAVKEIKSYNKESDYAARTGVNDGTDDQVLDVVIKPGWLDKWYGQTKLAATTRGNYEALLNAHRLSDSNPLLAMFNFNDFNKMTEPYKFYGTGWATGPKYRQQLGALGYQHNWNPSYDGWSKRNSFSITTFANHYDMRDNGSSATEYTLDNGSCSFSRKDYDMYNHITKLPLDLDLYYNLSKNDVLEVNAQVNYERNNNISTNKSNTRVDNMTQPSNSAQQRNTSLGNKFNTSGEVSLTHYHGKNEFVATAQIDYTDSDKSSLSKSAYEYHNLGITEHDILATELKSHSLMASASASASIGIGKNNILKLSYSYTANNRFSDSDVTRNDAHDAANSEYSDGSESKHSAMAGVTLNLGKVNVRPSFNLDFMHENINYRRGKLDTIAARNATMPKPRFELTWRPSRSQTIRANVAYSQTLPSIVSTLDYTDDTNPLFITQGNSRLKRSGLLKSDFNYSLIIPKLEQVFTLGIGFRKDYDPVGNVQYFNSATGVFRTRSENMRSGKSISCFAQYSIVPCDVLTINQNITFSNNSRYGAITVIDDDATLSYVLNRQRQIVYEPSFTISLNQWKIEGSSKMTFNRNTYSQSEIEKFNTFHHDTKLTIRYKVGIFALSLSPYFEGQSGYSTDYFNRSYFALDAAASASLLNKKLIVKLSADDIFNKKQSYSTGETATTRVDYTDYRIHNYLQLSIGYSFDAK